MSEDETNFLKNLDDFLTNKGKILKIFNPHNGKYQKLNELI